MENEVHILPELAGRLDGADAKKSKSSDAVSELEREAASELLSLMLSKIQIGESLTGGSCPLNRDGFSYFRSGGGG
jgi:hypothetical protein